MRPEQSWQGDGIVVVDDDERLVHLGRPGFDQPLVTRCSDTLPKRESSLEPGHTDGPVAVRDDPKPARRRDTPILIQNSR